MSLLRAVVAGLWESVRETLPSDEREAGLFATGFLVAMGVQWALLIAVTIAHLASRGGS